MTGSKLQQELKKNNPFESLEQEVSLNVLRSADVLISSLNVLFRQYGISHPQYNVLRILRGAGADGLACMEIADRMITRLPDMTRLLDRLQSAGLIQRQRFEMDRRIILVTITETGLKLLAELDQPVLDHHREQMSHFSVEELQQLNELLVKIRYPQGDNTEPRRAEPSPCGNDPETDPCTEKAAPVEPSDFS